MQISTIRRVSTYVLIVAFLLTLVPPRPANASIREAQECTAGMFLIGAIADYRLRSDYTNTLQQGYYRDYSLTLYRGNQYAIIGCACSGARDLDIVLLDDRGHVVAEDTLTDKTPIVEFTPRFSGRYTARVSMYDSRGGAPHYTIAILYR